ncbi:peptidoglycan/xylan/chitin deacetylase (PgdA/CDA1 family) [Aneurinibacillus soli]|uniref:Peptidoglycan-N-acetylglucosamine deacetylase n=1 Tax=Aneurinibacillus soli TaxID=1500254 RepID=A0A0U4WE74_9BACL|nr:polysaccharide deacetylase family protein [Aneurinibacillus soli]PYE62521.1 peptidoglycan/xylan/chitin deacetylase (PgdA/CDA1 family) [Aneurinibacillus soli]BAU27083.1 Peptidoglycan-N-acetylglucosamine deacetylase [Aneurinibacillus soli]
MGKLLLDGLLVFVLLYAVIPGIMARMTGMGAFRKGHRVRGIALTFDDGPDPRYTPYLLDLLKKYNVKATFFVVGSKAEKHPAIIRRMQEEGHVIGIHNYVHRSNWVTNPWKLWQQIHHSADIIERITGQRPMYYRPPWGLFTIFDFIMGKEFFFVLWSAMAGDWRIQVDHNVLQKRILTCLHGGCVLVLHDSGETFGADHDAPLYMLKALEGVLQDDVSKTYSFVLINEMMGHTSKNSLMTQNRTGTCRHEAR